MNTPERRVLLIDESAESAESADIVHGGLTYVVACTVVLTGDAERDQRSHARHQPANNPDRTRPFHWSSEGPAPPSSIWTPAGSGTIG